MLLENEIFGLATDNSLNRFFGSYDAFLDLRAALEDCNRSKTYGIALLVSRVLANNEPFISPIASKLTDDTEDLDIVKKFSLLCFYCYLQNVKTYGVSRLSFSYSFNGYDRIFDFFFKQNPNELEKLITHAIDMKLFEQAIIILQVFAKTNDISTLESGIGQFLKFVRENNIKLSRSALLRMQDLRKSIDNPIYRETYSETIENLDSFLAEQRQQTLDQDTENQSWIKRHKYPIGLFVGIVITCIPGALILSGIIALAPVISTVIGAILIAAALTLTAFFIASLIIKLLDQKKLEKPEAIVENPNRSESSEPIAYNTLR
jgi:hypothetical protein